LLTRVRLAACRRDMAELERTWAIASAQAESGSISKIAAAGELGPTRVHAIVRTADVDNLDTVLRELRSPYRWPAPEHPDGSRDEEAGRELIAGRLVDEVRWLRDCAAWLEGLSSASTRRWSTCALTPIIPTAATSSSTSIASGGCCCESPPTSTSSPEPGRCRGLAPDDPAG
jgi:hypothetical protein